MPDKRRELQYVKALQRALADFPTGDVVPSERPDVLVQSSSCTVGIEITVFHFVEGGSARPYQEQQALKDRIVQRAWSRHIEIGGPALYVSVHFTRSSLDKVMVEPLSDAIAAAVSRVAREPVPMGELSVPWQDLPSGIAFIAVHGSVDGRDQLWHADAGGWVAQVSPVEIQSVVNRKSRMVPVGRARCSELWLLIVNDQFSRAAQAEISDSAKEAEYVSTFDRLIWLVPHVPKAIPLITRSAA